MTRCMIKSNFFHKNSYTIELKNQEDIKLQEAIDDGDQEAKTEQKVLIEFCLPFIELKHIVDGLADEEASIQIDYPVDDCFL